ncbi:MAG: flagellar motor protein MotB [Clostridia bacterium]|nr:flagellar motor protein MotB [Clostridia bacterium]
MRKKKPIDNGPGVADWIVSYGDVMSLLLTFFVLLFSFSTIDAEKWKQIVQSFSGKPAVINIPTENEMALINLDTPNGSSSSIISDMLKKDEEMNEEEYTEENPPDKLEEINNITDIVTKEDALYEQLVKLSMMEENQWNLEILKTDEAIIIRFDNQILFKSGEADLDERAKIVLISVMDVVNKYENIIKKVSIEGNTDNVPINNSLYRDNFELSSARALVVLHYIIDRSEFPEKKLVAVAYGEFQPIDTNDTDEGRAKNRRTDIVLFKSSEIIEEVSR